MTRERAIQILKMNEQEKWRSGITAEEEKEAVDMAIEALKEQRPHGKIVKDEKGYPMCSRCGEKSSFWNFCPRCGADMKEGDEK